MEMQNGRTANFDMQPEVDLPPVIRPSVGGPQQQGQEAMREPTSPARRARDPEPANRSFEASELDYEDEYFRDDAATKYHVPNRLIGAVEVPMIVMNLDRAEKAFGSISTFDNVGAFSNPLERAVYLTWALFPRRLWTWTACLFRFISIPRAPSADPSCLTTPPLTTLSSR